MEMVTGDGVINLATGILSAVVVVGGFYVQRSFARRDERGRLYADALRALDDYLEAPYRIRRRDGSHAARMALTQQVSDIQVSLSYVQAAMTQLAPVNVAARFDDAQAAARREAGVAMTEAWAAAPTKRDHAVPLGKKIDMPGAQAARTKLVKAMAPGARMIPSSISALLSGAAITGSLTALHAWLGEPWPGLLTGVAGIVTAAVVASLVLPVVQLGRRRVLGAVLLIAAVLLASAAVWVSGAVGAA